MLYRAKIAFFKNARLNAAWRHWRARVGRPPGHYGQLLSYIRELAPGRSFADIGCMWGVNGAHAFAAEEAGARPAPAPPLLGPAPAFQAPPIPPRSPLP